MSSETAKTTEEQAPGLSRRKALAKLGLAAGVAYAAPVVLKLDRAANAAILPTPCPPPAGNCRNNPANCPC